MELKLSQEFERQVCLQSRRGRLNDDQEREARLKQSLYAKKQYDRAQLAAESPEERQGRLQGSYEC